jgi:hypothetical protein
LKQLFLLMAWSKFFLARYGWTPTVIWQLHAVEQCRADDAPDNV